MLKIKSKLLVLASVLSLGLSAVSCNSVQPILNTLPSNNAAVSAQSTEKFMSTAKKDLWIAQNTARRWDMSAELIKVEGQFIDQNGVCSSWIYYFKSSSKQKIYRVMGSTGAEVANSGFYGNTFDDFSWRIDTDKAIELAKKQGLKTFPISQMILEDRFGFEWEIRSSNGIFKIDAEYGTLK